VDSCCIFEPPHFLAPAATGAEPASDGRGPRARIGDDGPPRLDLNIGSAGFWMVCAGKPGTGRGLR